MSEHFCELSRHLIRINEIEYDYIRNNLTCFVYTWMLLFSFNDKYVPAYVMSVM